MLMASFIPSRASRGHFGAAGNSWYPTMFNREPEQSGKRVRATRHSRVHTDVLLYCREVASWGY